MDKNKWEKILVGSAAILAGTSIYLNKENKEIKKEYEKTKKKILEVKDDLIFFISGLKKMHKKYLLLGDNLYEHVKALSIDIPQLDDLKLDFFSERFVERDIQFFTPDMLMCKVSGLVDAYILNKWSIYPKEEKKKIPKKKLSNKKNLDIYNRNDVVLVLKKLKEKNIIEENDQNFILNLYDYFKEPIFNKRKIIDYDDENINFYFNYTIDMILTR